MGAIISKAASFFGSNSIGDPVAAADTVDPTVQIDSIGAF
ncbi:hypothetical protein J8273_7938 [Carpediemonas membranifera]|uniref:Uncharacterized protein n=1 Tax=Carpediemonas membranifera TaxID=201153 RepID=A0A8J6B0U0_9EUKA|nr:hypothetical protein J8273_7938 [Carpediemonas membranifera]|eukprot:KAG9390587.1 hypothetical protein J8273_7938 [Carpediemonas membranifera]